MKRFETVGGKCFSSYHKAYFFENEPYFTLLTCLLASLSSQLIPVNRDANDKARKKLYIRTADVEIYLTLT